MAGRRRQDRASVPYIASGRQAAPSMAQNAKPLNEQDLLWLRQPDEQDGHYEAFLAFRDSEPPRSLKMFGEPPWSDDGWTQAKAANLSSIWSWSYRTWHYDRYMGSVETEELVHYRRKMAKRHRAVAEVFINRAVEWLQATDPATWRANEAAQVLRIATEVQRIASGAVQIEQGMPGSPDQQVPDPGGQPGTLADLAGIDPTLRADLAEALHRITGDKEKR